MHKSDSRNHLKVDLGFREGVNGFGSSISLPSSPYGTVKHTAGIWTEKIKREKIMRERKLNKGAPDIDISDALGNSDAKKQQTPMIVLSNRLPFVLKRNEGGGLVRKAR